MRFRICPPGVILDIFKASQLDIGVVGTDSALAICNAADSLRWLYPAECRNLRKFATDAHSAKQFLSKCANWDRKKALIRFTPRSCGRYLMYKPETVPSSKHLQKDPPNCFGIWGFPSIRLGYQSTDINMIRPGDSKWPFYPLEVT